MRLVVLPLICALLASCGVELTDEPNYDSPHYYYQASSLIVEVTYETGAEPYEGNGILSTPLWNVTKDNLALLFQNRPRPPSISVPMSVAEMTKADAQGKSGWTASDILKFSRLHRTVYPSATNASFHILFLKGYFYDEQEQATKPSVLGLSINGTSIIAIFKDVVEQSDPIVLNTRKFVEQSTIVHEMGHALGLVNNGVPLTTSHHDSANGAHCSNSDCAMYWANEGGSALRSFVQRIIDNQSNAILGQECLDDAHAYRP